MTKRRVCPSCGHGATEKLLESLKDTPPPKPSPNRKPSPGRKTNAKKAQEWARLVMEKYR